MNSLTKEQIGALSPDQQAALAHVELLKLERKRKLERTARSWRGQLLVTTVLGVAGMAALYLFSGHSSLDGGTIRYCYLLLLLIIVGGQVGILHRRLDALLELRDLKS